MSYTPKIIEYHLDPANYLNVNTNKEYIFIHHTAGWENPYQTIDAWKSDDRGRIATKYVIGGVNIKTGDAKYDGVILEAFPGDGYAYHLGAVDPHMHSHSIGIEICSFGQLTKKGVNCYTYTNTLASPSQVCNLGYSFRGYQHYHAYSSNQIAALKYLITMLADTHKINVKKGLQEWMIDDHPEKAFQYNADAVAGKIKGLLSHTNVRKDKFDAFPQPSLINMIKTL